jgi:hypothetical protein
MTPETLNFSGNFITIFGFIGIVSTAIILIFVYRSYWQSPYRK